MPLSQPLIETPSHGSFHSSIAHSAPSPFFQYRLHTSSTTARRLEAYAGVYVVAFDLILATAIVQRFGIALLGDSDLGLATGAGHGFAGIFGGRLQDLMAMRTGKRYVGHGIILFSRYDKTGPNL
jgi:hypothetical protein